VAIHALTTERRSLHGAFDPSLPPALRVESGDLVTFPTLDGDWHIAPQHIPRTGGGTYFPARQSPGDDGHALIGPIYVEGARPGAVLQVDLLECVPGGWGWSRTGGPPNEHTRRMNIPAGEEHYLTWEIDALRGTARSNEGHLVGIDPFLGVLGVAPVGVGSTSTHPPGIHGGNLDCRALNVPCTLYLPVFHEGALFSAGDGHARQGDGEMGGTAIECPMDRVTVRLTAIRDDRGIGAPYARTRDAWLTFGFDEDLTQAAYQALELMARIMEGICGYERLEALSMASLLCDMHVTQIVNGVRGVHVTLPFDAARTKG